MMGSGSGAGPPGDCRGLEAILRFRVLGSLRVEAGSIVVPVTSPRQRAVLAVLVLHANRSVSAAELIDQVWGEGHPASAGGLVHTYIWQLRRLLAAHEPMAQRPRITRQPGGYLLQVAEGELDAHVFEQLAMAGLDALAAGDAAAASGHLRRALGLWSGEPLADLDLAGSAAAECGRLAELRDQAASARIEAGLALGQHAEAAAQLRALIAGNPLDEQLHAHLMTALSQSGRRAEALQVYAEARRLLAGELGLEPGPRLRELQAAILRGDSASGPAASRPTAAHPERRPDVGVRRGTLGQALAAQEALAFQGRAAELARVRRLLTAPGQLPRIVQIHGPPGIGKTAFAYALARMCNRRGHPAVILDSRDFGHDAAALGDAVAVRLARAQASGLGRPALLVLDTFEEMQDMERQFWDIFLPGLEGPILVALSGRQPPAAPAASLRWRELVDDLELGPLSAAESRRLLRHHGITDRATADSVAAFARGNPLFLTVAAQRARASRSWDADMSQAVAQSLIGQITRETADPGVRRLLEAASLVRTFNQELLEEMTGGDVSDSFAGLCTLSVVRVVPAGARLHDLVRESIATDLGWRAPAASQEMRRRACAYLTTMAASSPDPGPYAQELLHLAAASSARARLHVQSDHPGVRIRLAAPGDLPRLNELCTIGATRCGLPPAERIRQLNTDFDLARPSMVIALDDDGSITGFSYSVDLNSSTWQTAAQTRGPYFDTLPAAELAAIKAAPAGSFGAGLWTGVTHLPDHHHVNAALSEGLFAVNASRLGLGAGVIVYNLLTADTLDLPYLTRAGFTPRTTSIPLEDCLADEWVCAFGEQGIAGWATDALKGDVPAYPP
jgi:DNA-binding SARP family transcriptional activator